MSNSSGIMLRMLLLIMPEQCNTEQKIELDKLLIVSALIVL